MNSIETLKRTDLLRERCLVGGQWTNGNSTFDVFDKATAEKIASVPNFGADETKQAIDQAYKALSAWRAKTPVQRSALLRKWFDLAVANASDLAKLTTAESGKPLKEAEGEAVYAAAYIEWFAEEAKRMYGDVIPNASPDQRIVVIKQGVGVCAGITPWNFPLAMITRKAAPALAAGCTIVLKPAGETPLSALALAALADEAGIPAGVINLLTGDEIAIGKELTGNPLVRKVTFTGSTPVGKLIVKQSAETLKKVTMELGGNAPFIVFPDADIDKAVQGAIAAKYRNAGQTCICTNRFLIHSRVFDEFTDKFTKQVSQLKVGNGFEPGVDIGPLISQEALEKTKSFIADATEKGAEITFGGRPHSSGKLFFEPTVVTKAKPAMRFFQEEIFGPVAPLYAFEDEAEAVQLANSTPYGLAGYFYGRDIGRIWRVAEALEFGMVGVNTGLISNVMAPFGGIKESGYGREGSKYGLDDYTTTKYVCMAGIES
ncbi:MAG: NAD-dependent succinate-semialdehyde dehydrogenase [Verrucomicrobia bacterium]|nr:NAD-dependent succinate-semialdehyde dehydrogenase [Verrucomicrobiota bacterium]